MGQPRPTIALNFLPVTPEMGGGETYARSLLAGLEQVETNANFLAFLNRESEGHFDMPEEVTSVETGIPASNRFYRYAFEQALLPRLLNRQDVDVLFCPSAVMPLRLSIPTVVTIHDANFVDVPATFSRVKRAIISRMYPWSAERADRVLTVSEFSKERLADTLDVPSWRISVVYNPLPLDFRTSTQPGLPTEIDKPYLFSAGKDYPHKNLDTLLRAIPHLPEELSVVLSGFEAGPDHRLFELCEELDITNRVTFRGFIPQDELHSLYAHAEAYVHPSMYEGFGFPVIEAMAHGTPVVSSDAASLPEVADDAARFVNASSVSDLSEGILEVYQNIEYQEELRRRGVQNVERFSVAEFADGIVSCCMESLRD